MTREEFARLLLVLQAGIGREFSSATMEVWFLVLGDLATEDLQYAISRYLAESQSGFPVPGQLRALADDRRNPETLDHSQAFSRLMKAVRHFGRYQSELGMASLDELTQVAVRGCGGFVWFCELECDQRLTAAAQFRLAYQSSQQAYLRDRRLPPALRPAIAHRQRSLEHESMTLLECETGPRQMGEILASRDEPIPGRMPTASAAPGSRPTRGIEIQAIEGQAESIKIGASHG